jgi:hypothetical protein
VAGVRPLEKEILMAEAVKKYPALFTADQSGIPLHVGIRVSTYRSDLWSGLLTFLPSLGILPGRDVFLEDKGIVAISVVGAFSSLSATTGIAFSSKDWVSVWTPLGAFMKDLENVGTYNGVARKGWCVSLPTESIAPKEEGRIHQREVFAETVVEAIVAGLAKLDRSEIERVEVLRRLRKGE